MTSRRPLLAVLSLLLPAAIVVFAACTDQGEGERCDTRASRNGSDDCQQGLSCVPASDLGGEGTSYCVGVPTCGVCCPEDRANATVDVCRLASSLLGADAAPPATDASDDAASDAAPAADAADASGDDADAATSDAASSDASDASDAASDGPG